LRDSQSSAGLAPDAYTFSYHGKEQSLKKPSGQWKRNGRGKRKSQTRYQGRKVEEQMGMKGVMVMKSEMGDREG